MNFYFLYVFELNSLRFVASFISDCQFSSSFGTTCGQYSASVCSCHSLTETMFVSSSPVGWLECPFHRFYLNYLNIPVFGTAKIDVFFD